MGLRADVDWPAGARAASSGGDEVGNEESKGAVREAIQASKTPLERLADDITSVDSLRARRAEIVSELQKPRLAGRDVKLAQAHLDTAQ